ncbi:DUF5801 repeats-in-toxin domain-containing protein, partial [Vibrio sp. TH_r3]|uniref:DUF5801 repeats-in-toxin domain-containing protein n=1 Tax=Vibrio sp. TH_r3 TaxID=3082084 RepID=UPI002952BCD4
MTQYLPLDQTTDGDSNVLPLSVTATDTDGSQVTADLTVTIVDGPNATASDSAVELTETQNGVVTGSSSANFVTGSDEITKVEWVISDDTKTLLENLTTNDAATSWELSTDGKTITVVRDSDDAEVLRLTVDDLTGNYTVTQSLPIDQDVEATDGDANGSAESLSLSEFDLTLKATDSDGDET